MSLMIARGPLSPHRAGWFSEPVPGDLVYVEPHPRRIQALVDGQVVLDTERGAPGAPPATDALVRLPGRRGGRPPPRARARGAGPRRGAVGRGRHLARGGPAAGALPAEPVPPGRLPPDRASAARRGRRDHARRHRPTP